MSSILFNFVFARASHTTAYCTSTIQFCVITNTSRYKFCFVEQDIWTVQLKMLALGAWTKKRSKADKTEKNLKDEMSSQVQYEQWCTLKLYPAASKNCNSGIDTVLFLA
jgi:hypothetical protein